MSEFLGYDTVGQTWARQTLVFGLILFGCTPLVEVEIPIVMLGVGEGSVKIAPSGISYKHSV